MSCVSGSYVTFVGRLPTERFATLAVPRRTVTFDAPSFAT